MKQKLLIILSALLFTMTISAQTEQQQNEKLQRTDVVVIDGYLKVYPQELGEFSEEPLALISQLNKECKYGYDSWRVPTQREMNMIRSNGYTSNQKYMTQSDYSGILLLVTTQEKLVKDRKDRIKLPIKKQELSVHAGYTLSRAANSGVSIGFKYIYKPFKKYDIRLFGEIGGELINRDNSYSTYYYEPLPPNAVLPIIVGVNYDYRINQKWSVFGDLGFGFNITLAEEYNHSWSETDYWEYYDVYRNEYYNWHDIGFVLLSPEIGIKYNEFMFSFKFNLSCNQISYKSSYEYEERYSSDNRTDEGNYFAFLSFFSMRLGYRF